MPSAKAKEIPVQYPYQKHVKLCVGIEDLESYDLTLPDHPAVETITNYGLPLEEQIFRRERIPKEVSRLNHVSREEAINISTTTPAISEFIEKMWYKFVHGDFQIINGEIIHLSPTYWFYLNFWHLDTGLPKFRYDKVHYCTDLWEFAWWDYCVQTSPVCYGEIQGSKRRGGKSFKAMCKAYKRIIGRKNFNGCLQSKSDTDAAECFSEKMVLPWTKLLWIFKAQYANSSYPKGEGLQFKPRSIKGKGATESVYLNPDDYLFSQFVYKNSKETAADGYKWQIHVSDEDGKTPDIDVWDRHTVIKPCLTEDGRIIGKEIATTTVEDMDKGGGAKFCYKWKMSDRRTNRKPQELTVDKYDETASGLWQWFCPARCNEVHNRYGCAIVETPTKYEQKYLKDKGDTKYFMGGRERIKEMIAKQKTQIDQQKVMRKYPEEVRDMFIITGGYCHFDLPILNTRLKHFAFGYEGTPEANVMRFGNLEWKGAVYGGDVEFLECEQDNARFWFSYIPDESIRNKFTIHETTGKKVPANWHKFASGADAFKFDTEDVINKDKMSLGSMSVWAGYDIMVDTPDKHPDDWVTNDMCMEYLARPDTVDDLCEDYLKACVFFGMKAFPEKNNPEVVAYFKRNGFQHYLQFDMQLKKVDDMVYLADKSAGGNTDAKSIQSMFKAVQKYVKDNGLRCKFYRTLEQLKHVSPDDMNPYDLFVSLATCLRVVQEFNPIRFATEEVEEDVGDIADSLNPTYFVH